MADSADKRGKNDKTCAVCGRRLLLGERTNAYVSREGAEVEVCELCKSRAESAGWMRPEDAAPAAGGTGRRPRRKRGELLSGILSRTQREGRREARRERGGRAEREPRSAEPGEDLGAEDPAEPAAPRASAAAPGKASTSVGSSAGPDVNQAVAAFNASDNRRTIAGLSRSLGRPRATVIAVRTASGATGARLTVAWDLAWYQWEIGPGRRHPEIRQSGKGETIDQLRAADRNWNLEMAEDGELSRGPRSGA